MFTKIEKKSKKKKKKKLFKLFFLKMDKERQKFKIALIGSEGVGKSQYNLSKNLNLNVFIFYRQICYLWIFM